MEARETDAPLLEAINKADLTILRSVLQSMCKSSAECHKEAAERLLLRVGKKRKADGSPEAEANKKPMTVVSRFEKCITCKKIFDITDNRDDSCRTHRGYLYIVDDFFVDDDEITYGNIDPYTDWRREEWPEGFMWHCCETTLKDDKPCRVQKHIAARSDGPNSQATNNESPVEISSDED
ncbi:hypothetical protein KJ359_010464 [Pestalotiopsis sp. 9143b]|nr:hypothetical protein KJ359_010464 [Pestalotiopsis sp. 9143b]